MNALVTKPIEAVVVDTGEVVAIGAHGLSLPGRVSNVGLELPDDLTFAEWQGIGESLKGVERSLMWWLGDWLRFGERRYGEMYAQALDATEKSYDRLAQAKWVAGKFESCRRRQNLGFSHHVEVAALEPRAADRLLDLAAGEGWSQKELRRRVSQTKVAAKLMQGEQGTTCTVADLWGLVESGRKFGSIYADPPWLYDNQGTRAATGNHYGGMTVEELCALPVKDFAADDAHLHLWTTNGFLFECPRILAAWGFEFRSTFVWIKPQMGIGNYWRNSHEILLTGIRGDAKRFNDHSIKSWLECDRGAHSAKPERVRDFIRRTSPSPFIEMFARWPAEGWAVWGDGIERTLFNQSLGEAA